MFESFSCTVFCRSRALRFGKSTRSISWSWLKHEKMNSSRPVTGSTCFCRHCAHTSFIMHCIGELMLAMAMWSGRRCGASTPWRAAFTAAIMRSEPMAMMRDTVLIGTSGVPSSPLA